MGIYQPNASTLLYGGAGAGKTPLGVSSFWDWKNRKMVAKGKYITFGAEDNPVLAIPEECRHTDKGTSLRLTSPLLDDQKFLADFDAITQRFIYDAEQGNSPDVIFLDGLSEFDLLFEETFEGETTKSGSENKFAKWDALLSEFYSMMMRLHHDVMKCQVIMTARVAERKRGSKSATFTPDPGHYNFDYYPSVRGGFRHYLPHYYTMVLFVEQETRIAEGGRWDGKPIPCHVVHMVRDGEYYIKNQFEHTWLATEDDTELVNPMWPDMWRRLNAANEKWEAQFEGENDGKS